MVLHWSMTAKAQFKSQDFDSTYIHVFREKLQVQVFLGNRSNEIRVYNPDPSKSIIYVPNMPVQFGMGLDHHWLSLEAAVKLRSSTEGNPSKGNSRYFGLGGAVNGRELWFNAQYSFFRGFHVSNPQSIQPNWSTLQASYPLRSDILSNTLSTQLVWSKNYRKFSYLGAIEQREKQVKSAGSLLMGMGLSAIGISADSSMAAGDSVLGFEKDAQIKESGFLVFSPQIGYGYTLVLPANFFFTIMLLPSLNLFTGTTILANNEEIPYRFTGLIGSELRLIIGYDNERTFAGMHIHRQGYSSDPKNRIYLSNNFTTVRFYFGMRFTTPEKLSRFVKSYFGLKKSPK